MLDCSYYWVLWRGILTPDMDKLLRRIDGLKRYFLPLGVMGLLLLLGLSIYFLRGSSFPMLHPKGIIALHERNLMLLSTLLMSMVVLPVLGLTGYIAWRYRKDNLKATYTPEWDHNLVFESIWWGIPCVIVLALAILTFKSSHQLDPARALASDQSPLHVQVVALQWRWLFIYPEQGIASINLIEMPKDRPVHFDITSDAPMNSFWIPQLGGQIYAMTGMTTQLNLVANRLGTYAGSSANLSGKGFSTMHFSAVSVTSADFDRWVMTAKSSKQILGSSNYAQLAQPSEDSSVKTYALKEPTLFQHVVNKNMSPDSMPSMEMR